MSRLRVESFSISLDGFGADPKQDLDNPLCVGGSSLHGWALSTPTFQKHVFGSDGGVAGIDEDFAARGFQNIGAWILGRNMFGPARGPWPNESWRRWWGENPVYHVPVFVLTNHPRAPLVMEGGTTFHFVTEGPAVALARTREAAAGKDVRVGGGVNVIQQYLRLRLIEEMHIAIAPVLLGSGERLFEGVNPSFWMGMLKGSSRISPEMALRLSKSIGRNPESWLAMQDAHDLWLARQHVDLRRVGKLPLAAA